jgi:glutathione-independent formaldehyde dehydrogenase
MWRGRAGALPGTQFGHEITGEVVEVGPDVEFIRVGDWVSVPFNVACGRCQNCICQNTHICLNVNKMMPGGAFGYVNMGDWPGGQAEYVLCPYADFNLLRLQRDKNTEETLLDLALLSDILPTGYHGAVTAGVTTGSTVYVVGAGPVGLCAAACALQVLGAETVIVSDYEESRLAQARALGCETILMTEKRQELKESVSMLRQMVLGQETIGDLIEKITGEKVVDSVIDCAGYETCGHHGHSRADVKKRSEVLNDAFWSVKYGGGIGVPGVYLPQETNADDAESEKGKLSLDYGVGWCKGFHMTTGQCPVLRYNRKLQRAVLGGRLHVAEYLNPTLISLDEAPRAYEIFDSGAPRKFIIDPHGLVPERSKISGHSKVLTSIRDNE